MSNFSASSNNTTVARNTSDGGNQMQVRGTRDGAATLATWVQALIMEGRCYQAKVGAFSTPVVGGGNGTIVDQDQPEFVISIPSGTSILPFRVHAQAQQPLTANDSDESEIILAVDRLAAWAIEGTGVVVKPFNLRTDQPRESACSIVSAHSVNITNPTLGLELAHSVVIGDVQGTVASALWTKHELLYAPRAVPIIVGPAKLIVYWGGTVATSAFAQVHWAELPTTAFS